MTPDKHEEGASLIFALVFTLIIAVAAVALAGLGFSAQKASNVYGVRDPLISALDSGIQAAVENGRVDPQRCGSDPGATGLVHVPVVGPTGPTGPVGPTNVNGYDVTVSCLGPIGPTGPTGATGPTVANGQYALQATQATEVGATGCNGPPVIKARAAFGPAGPSGERTAQITSWKVVPSPPCVP